VAPHSPPWRNWSKNGCTRDQWGCAAVTSKVSAGASKSLYHPRLRAVAFPKKWVCAAVPNRVGFVPGRQFNRAVYPVRNSQRETPQIVQIIDANNSDDLNYKSTFLFSAGARRLGFGVWGLGTGRMRRSGVDSSQQVD